MLNGLPGGTRAGLGSHSQSLSHCPSQEQGSWGAAPSLGFSHLPGDRDRPRLGWEVSSQDCGELETSTAAVLLGQGAEMQSWVMGREVLGGRQGQLELLVPTGTWQTLLKQEELQDSLALRVYYNIYKHPKHLQYQQILFYMSLLPLDYLVFHHCRSSWTSVPFSVSVLILPVSLFGLILFPLVSPSLQSQIKSCIGEATDCAQDVNLLLCVI